MLRTFALRNIATLALAIITSTCAVNTAHSEAIAWRSNLASAQQEAQQSGKLVLIHFYTEACGPCRLLEKNVFSLPSVGMALEANYIPVKLNANSSPTVAQHYGVSRVPMDVVTDAQGNAIKSMVSPATPMAYVAVMTEEAGKHRSQQGVYQQIARNAPAQPGLQRGTSPLNPIYSKLSNPSLGTPVTKVASVANRYASLASQPASRYAAAQQAPPVAPAVAANPYVTQSQPALNQVQAPAPAAQQPVTQPVAQPAVQQVTQQPRVQQVAPQPRAQQPVAPAVQAVAPAVSSDITPIEVKEPTKKIVAKVTGPQLPAGSPPLGFDGYCAVTMKSKWEWIKGDVKWGAIHRGRTYLFTSAENRDQFLTDPEKFSPALSGSDPVMAVDARQTVAGTRQYSLEYEGKFYFFANEQTLNKFWTNADGYAKGADRVAAAINASGTMLR